MHHMHEEEREELERLAAAERAGQLLTGAERGRLADLRRTEILYTVAAGLPSSAERAIAAPVEPAAPVMDPPAPSTELPQ